jgi:hypothetical protein
VLGIGELYPVDTAGRTPSRAPDQARNIQQHRG